MNVKAIHHIKLQNMANAGDTRFNKTTAGSILHL